MESKFLLRSNKENNSCNSLHVSVVWFGFLSIPFDSLWPALASVYLALT